MRRDGPTAQIVGTEVKLRSTSDSLATRYANARPNPVLISHLLGKQLALTCLDLVVCSRTDRRYRQTAVSDVGNRNAPDPYGEKDQNGSNRDRWPCSGKHVGALKNKESHAIEKLRWNGQLRKPRKCR